MNIDALQPIGKKIWVKNRWDEYEASRNTQAIERSITSYYDPTNEELEDRIDKSKWKSTVDRKVNYLLARKPVVREHQDILDDLLPFIRETAVAYTLRGSLIWIVQGDDVGVIPRPLIMSDTIAIYSDQYKEKVVAYIRKYTETEIDDLTGEETVLDFYELYYISAGVWKRDTYHYEADGKDIIADSSSFPQGFEFIELGKTGDAPLFAYVEKLIEAFDHVMRHQDTGVVKNTKPVTEVKGYTGTSDADLQYALEQLSIVKVDGDGGLLIHNRAMDSASIDIWIKRLMQEFYEATATVGKENELQYAMSGKAMDRLFVDMENSARELAEVLEEALVAYFDILGYEGVDIIWNTDRPIDDAETISGIAASRGLVSDLTLLEQHPWIDDVEREQQRLKAEISEGMLGLVDETDFVYDFDEEVEE